MTTSAQQTALEKAAVRFAYFIEFQFQSATTRVSTFNQTVTWGGYEWTGLGSVGSIGQVEESDSLEAKPLVFSINAAQPAWIALAAGPVEEYRGRKARMWMAPLDEGYQLIDEPQLCWSGIMDVVSLGIDGDEGGISLKCESSAYGLKRMAPLRLNHAQQQQRHPGDTGFQYLEDLIAKPALWLSKTFQRI